MQAMKKGRRSAKCASSSGDRARRARTYAGGCPYIVNDKECGLRRQAYAGGDKYCKNHAKLVNGGVVPCGGCPYIVDGDVCVV